MTTLTILNSFIEPVLSILETTTLTMLLLFLISALVYYMIRTKRTLTLVTIFGVATIVFFALSILFIVFCYIFVL